MQVVGCIVGIMVKLGYLLIVYILISLNFFCKKAILIS